MATVFCWVTTIRWLATDISMVQLLRSKLTLRKSELAVTGLDLAVTGSDCAEIPDLNTCKWENKKVLFRHLLHMNTAACRIRGLNHRCLHLQVFALIVRHGIESPVQ